MPTASQQPQVRIPSAAICLIHIGLLFSASISAHEDRIVEVPNRDAARVLDQITVLGRRENLTGAAISASQGVISAEELQRHPVTRAGDLIEYVPGMVATQHSGSGKANQYFLRGFNLDHGTDFATFVEDTPVNLRTHGHGQGYTDLNFLIPEMIGELRYRKGAYSADVGDFAAAGSSTFRLASDLGGHSIGFSAGSFGYARGLLLGSQSFEQTTLSYGGELQRYDGPWSDVDEDVNKKNFSAKLTHELAWGKLRASVMAYDNRWRSPDQIPERAVQSGLINELGSLDTDLGGESSRYSASLGFNADVGGGIFDISTYVVDYDFSLFSNFTYFLDDPVNGDEFEQFDERQMFGGALSQSWFADDWNMRVGADARTDLIDRVGLSRTAARALVRPIRDDKVREASVGLFVDGEYRLTEHLRAYAGLRYDRFRYDVAGNDCETVIIGCLNAGRAEAGTSSSKASLIYTLSKNAELYLSYGEGFHSNDARGTTILVDPLSGMPVDAVTPLVDTFGYELGARWYLSDKLNATLALWQLKLDSELLFVGDAGTTEASRPSARRGVELGMYYFAERGWDAELEASFTRSRFRADGSADDPGSNIPGSIPLVVSAGFNVDIANGYRFSTHARHFGRYPLIEDGSVRSEGATLVNMGISKSWQALTGKLELINALDSNDHDIDYFYASRVAGEPEAGVEDIHYHVLEPRALRLSLSYRF